MSSGSRGSTPCAMEYGDWPVDLFVVTQSAQKTCGARVGHCVILPLHALTRDSWIVWCECSTMPLALESYGEMRMC